MFIDVSVSYVKNVFLFKRDRCWSYVGRVFRVQRISLDDGCHFETTVMHEVRFRLRYGEEVLQIAVFLKF